MREQMIVAILVVPLTFGTETKLEIGVVKLRPATDRAFMFCYMIARRCAHLRPKLLPSAYLMRRVAA